MTAFRCDLGRDCSPHGSGRSARPVAGRACDRAGRRGVPRPRTASPITATSAGDPRQPATTVAHVSAPATDARTSARLSRQRRRDTVPEVALRRELHRRGRRFFVDRAPCRACDAAPTWCFRAAGSRYMSTAVSGTPARSTRPSRRTTHSGGPRNSRATWPATATPTRSLISGRLDRRAGVGTRGRHRGGGSGGGRARKPGR